jgi:hypothetical protein
MTELEAREPVVTEVDADELIQCSVTRMAALLDDLKAMVSQGPGRPGTRRTWEPAELVALAERLEEERQALLAITRHQARTGTELPAAHPPGDRRARH